jgi:hypothetical protein
VLDVELVRREIEDDIGGRIGRDEGREGIDARGLGKSGVGVYSIFWPRTAPVPLWMTRPGTPRMR